MESACTATVFKAKRQPLSSACPRYDQLTPYRPKRTCWFGTVMAEIQTGGHGKVLAFDQVAGTKDHSARPVACISA